VLKRIQSVIGPADLFFMTSEAITSGKRGEELKELVIEKALTKIEDTWVSLQVSFAPFGAGSEVRCAVACLRCVSARSPGARCRCSTSSSTRPCLRRSRTTTWRCRT
jgi:hypothetical protein